MNDENVRRCGYCDADVDERYEERKGIAVSDADVWFCGECLQEIVDRWYWRKDGKGRAATQPVPDSARRQREFDEDDGA